MSPVVLSGIIPSRISPGIALVLLLWTGFAVASPHSRTRSESLSSEYAYGDNLCSNCHSGITSAYARTAMAQASGLASEKPIEGEFFHKKSKIDYRVKKQGDKLWLDF